MVAGRRSALVAAALALVLVPLTFAEATVYKLGLVLIVLVGAIGLHLLVNWAGELSLAQAAVVGFPAFFVAKVSADHGLSPLYLVPLGVAAGAAVGAVIGLPALRARGLQVALMTLAAGVAIDRYFFTKTWFVGPAAGARVAEPRLGPVAFDTARSLYPLLVLLVLGAVGAAWMLYRSKLGRGMLWMQEEPTAAAAFGVPVAQYRVLAYALAGAFAGLAGALTAVWVQRLTPQAFPLTLSFTYLVIVVLAGRGFVAGVAVAAIAIEGGRLFLPGADALIVYGAPIALIFALTRYRGGLNGAVAQVSVLLRGRRRVAEVPPRHAAAAGADESPAAVQPLAPARPLLEVRDARISFGGLNAVDGVTLHVDEGAIVGLIGPNGAGKTTLFDGISGARHLDGGRVLLRGHDITRLPAHRRARHGIGRSFQNLGLMTPETVNLNLTAAQHLGIGYTAWDLVVRPWRWWRGERRAAERARAALARFDLADGDRPVEDLSFAAARSAELAAVLVEGPDLMLLDEPTTGLDAVEVATLREALERLRAQGTTILVIAHDVGFVMQCCDHVYVLAEGRILSEGRPETVQHKAAVIDAYLGVSA